MRKLLILLVFPILVYSQPQSYKSEMDRIIEDYVFLQKKIENYCYYICSGSCKGYSKSSAMVETITNADFNFVDYEVSFFRMPTKESLVIDDDIIVVLDWKHNISPSGTTKNNYSCLVYWDNVFFYIHYYYYGNMVAVTSSGKLQQQMKEALEINY